MAVVIAAAEGLPAEGLPAAVGAVVVAVVLRAAPTTTLLRLLHNAVRSTIVAVVVHTMVKVRQELLVPVVAAAVVAVDATRIGTRARAAKTTGTSDQLSSVLAMQRR